jgi:hypothetical protein
LLALRAKVVEDPIAFAGKTMETIVFWRSPGFVSPKRLLTAWGILVLRSLHHAQIDPSMLIQIHRFLLGIVDPRCRWTFNFTHDWR